MVLQFLSSMFNDGLAYNSLNTARSALSSVMFNNSGSAVGCSGLINAS